MKTWTMELKVRYSTPGKDDTLEGIIRTTMKDLLTSAILLQDTARPIVSIRCSDSVHGAGDVELISPDEAEEFL